MSFTFYPTYEEWKLGKVDSQVELVDAFYPTYEEWKHKPSGVSFITFKLFILPMRNGNSASLVL